MNHFKYEIYQLTSEPSTSTSQRTYWFYIIKTCDLMLFREIIAVYSENRRRHVNTLCGKIQIFNVKVSSTSSYHCASKAQTQHEKTQPSNSGSRIHRRILSLLERSPKWWTCEITLRNLTRHVMKYTLTLAFLGLVTVMCDVRVG
jgi:hypothetical protein